MVSRWIPLTLALLLLAAAPSRAIELPRAYDVYLWPLLTIDADETGSETRFLIPLGEISNKDGKAVRAVYPLFARKRIEDGEHSTDVLWPLAHFARKPDGSHDRRVFPLFWGVNAERGRHAALFPLVWTWWHPFKRPGDQWGVVVVPAWNVEDYGEGKTDYHRGLAPLWWAWRDETNHGFWAMPVYWQKDADESQRSLGVLPFYFDWRYEDDHGVWVLPVYWSQDKANQERVLSILPFYLDWRDKDEHGVWALPVYWQGNDGDTDTLVVFPIYWQGEDHHVLFPFYWSYEDGKTRVLFPIYGRTKGDDHDWLMVLWPGYMRSRNDNRTTHRVLWPLLKWASDEDGDSEFALWPLLGTENYSWESETYDRKGRRNWALWPVAWWGRSESTSRPKTSKDSDTKPQPTLTKRHHLNLAPLFWSRGSETFELLENDTPGEVTDSEYRNWLLPLYTYDKNPDRTVLTAAWPLWRDLSTEEMEQYSVLWRLLDARYYANGDKRVSVLWRGYRNEKRGDVHKLDMFPFMSYRRTGAEKKRFQFLGGLFQLGAESGQRHMRLFYSPRIPLGKAD
jgi:hypothetical protein